MWTGLITHPACLGHLPPPGHPESADRLRAVLRALEKSAFQDLVRIEAPCASKAALLRAHTPAHVEAIVVRLTTEAREQGTIHIDAGTGTVPSLW